MNRFEFIMVMLSIIVGLGVTELLTNVAKQIRAREKCKPYWLQSGVVVIILLALLQQWWESWGLQDVGTWSFPFVLMMLGGPIGLFVVSHLLFPDKIEGADLERHYFETSSLIWGLAAVLVLIAFLFRPLAFGAPLFEPDNLAPLFILGVCVTLMMTKRKTAHALFVPLILLAVLLDILVFNPEI